MTSIPKPNEVEDGAAVTAGAEIFVLGGGATGAAVARRLRRDGHTVTLVDGAREPVDVTAHRGDPTDVRALRAAGLESASTVIVATPSDSRNLLIAQLVRVRFDVDHVLVLANEPDRVGVLSDAGHVPVCASTVLAGAVVEHL